MDNKAQQIIFYDGDCGFCNKSVQLILKHEKNQTICFAALQSDFARSFFEEHHFPAPDLSTFYYWDGQKLHSKSGAALRVLDELKFPWPLLKSGYILPRSWRDKMYDFIAARRHKLANGFCALPTPEQRQRFLK